MRVAFAVAALTAVLSCPSTAAAIPITYDFEEFADSNAVTSLAAPLGVTLTLSNAAALTAGISLNDFDFPPTSGTNVLFDSGGAISIGFSSAVSSLAGFFTYTAPVTITAFLGGSAIGSVSSVFTQNFVSSGNAPNELLQLTGLGLFDEVLIAGDALGGSFTLDDLTVDVPEPTARVPEPGTLGLVTLGAALLLRRNRPRGPRSAPERAAR